MAVPGARVLSAATTVAVLLGVPMLCPVPVMGQITWETTISWDYNEEAAAVLEVPQGGYVVAGHTSSYGPGSPDYTNPYLMKLDPYGQTVWTRYYGTAEVEHVFDLCRDRTGGGYLICGQRDHGGVNNDGLLIKCDSSGNEVWSRAYGHPWYDVTLCAISSREGGYLALGATTAGPYPVFSDAWLVRLAANGDTLWTRTYGGPMPDMGRSMVELPNSEIVLCVMDGKDGLHLIKVDPKGSVLWNRSYPDLVLEQAYQLLRTVDHGFAVLGTARDINNDFDVVLVRCAADGTLQWSRQYDFGQGDLGYAFDTDDDAGFTICGMTTSLGAGQQDVLLMRTNKGGDVLWTRRHGAGHSAWSDIGYAVQNTSDGGIIAAGLTTCVGPGAGIYVVKTNRNGLLTRETASVAVGAGETLRILPNPFEGTTAVVGAMDAAEYLVYDSVGRLVATQAPGMIGAGLRPGVYFVRDPRRALDPLKVIKLR